MEILFRKVPDEEAINEAYAVLQWSNLKFHLLHAIFILDDSALVFYTMVNIA